MLTPHLPALDDPEGSVVPADLPPVIDAHVHVFPSAIFSAVHRWFDAHAWPIRYRMATSDLLDFLLSRGVRHVVALQYAHKPGIADGLNRYLADKCRQYPGRVTGMATVFPGEPDAGAILEAAFAMGLAGVKLHAHVQCFDMTADEMAPIYEICAAGDRPLLMHVGREPKSPAYPCDPYAICRAEELEAVLNAYPALRVCVPHLGFDELAAYRRLIERYETLWLDTTMVVTDYFPLPEPVDLRRYRPDRVMYGTDFPNIPYAWDRELMAIRSAGLPADHLARLLGGNAAEFFGIEG